MRIKDNEGKDMKLERKKKREAQSHQNCSFGSPFSVSSPLCQAAASSSSSSSEKKNKTTTHIITFLGDD